MSSDLHYQSLTSVSDLIRRRKLSPGGSNAGNPGEDCPARWSVPFLRDCTGGSRARARKSRRGGNRPRPLARAAARRADRGEGPLQHDVRADGVGDHDLQGFHTELQRHCGRSVGAKRRGHSRQAQDDRGGLHLSSSRGAGASQSLEHRLLGRIVLHRFRRRYVSRALLRQPWHGHRRLDTLPLRHLRPDGDQADLGTGEPARRVSARRIARSRRAR